MNFLKKIFSNFSSQKKLSVEEEVENNTPLNLSTDDLFVHNFIKKGGKFLYCTTLDEVLNFIKNIISENSWNELYCDDVNLLKLTSTLNIKTQQSFNNNLPFFTTCEHLIANEGNLLFSSNQLGANKLNQFSENFIVYATTSQLVKNTGEGLAGIKTNYAGNIPTNICSIKNYSMNNLENNFLDSNNSSSKNLYLILFEDL